MLASRRFEFQKSRQLFIRVHNESLSVVAMRVSNPDCSPVGNQSLRRSPQLQPALLRVVSDSRYSGENMGSSTPQRRGDDDTT